MMGGAFPRAVVVVAIVVFLLPRGRSSRSPSVRLSAERASLNSSLFLIDVMHLTSLSLSLFCSPPIPSDPFLPETFQTNGNRSDKDDDAFIWPPRSASLAALFESLIRSPTLLYL